jgi:hypothetical protein
LNEQRVYLKKLGLRQAIGSSRWLHPLLLLVWIVVGAGSRLTHLTAKAAWADEFSTGSHCYYLSTPRANRQNDGVGLGIQTSPAFKFASKSHNCFSLFSFG